MSPARLPIPPRRQNIMEAATGLEPVIRVLQTHALPLGYAAKNWSGRRGSNSRPPPWQGGVLPLNYFRIKLGYLDSNQGMTGSKPVALPLGYTPLIRWGGRGELNPRVPESQSGALTTSPRPPLYYCIITNHVNENLGRTRGIEPPSAGITIRCVNHFATTANIKILKMAGAVGIEPTSEVLETSVLPLNYAPKNWWWGADSNCRTRRSGFTVRRV